MVRYETKLNKAIVQDWQQLEAMDDQILKARCLTQRQIAALVGMCEYLEWQSRYDNPPVVDVLKAFAAQLVYALTNGCDMDCEELIACLTPLFEQVIDAINAQTAALKYGNGLNAPPGSNPGEEQNNANQVGPNNPECDFDVLWAQCTQLVEWAVNRATDALEQAEAANNNVEALNAFYSLPIINLLGPASVTGYINLLLEGVAEGFAAAVTETYKQELACEMFCAFKVDCEISIASVYAIMDRRMRAYFADLPTSFATFLDLCQYLVGQPLDGDTIADGILFVGWGGLSLANAMFNDVGDRPMQLLLQLAVNDANDDWVLLCDDCPTGELVPVINEADWVGPSAGTIVRVVGNIWKATTTSASGWRITIKEQTDQPFVISDISYNGITPQCNWYEYEAGSTQVFDGCTGSPAYTGAALLNFGKTFLISTEMTFTINEP